MYIFRRMPFSISIKYGCRHYYSRIKQSKFTNENPNCREYWTKHSWDHIPCGWFGLIREGKAFNEHSYVDDWGGCIPGDPGSDEIESYIDCNEGGRIYWIEGVEERSRLHYIAWLNNRIYSGLSLPMDINAAMDAEITQKQEEIAREQEAIEKEITEQREQYMMEQEKAALDPKEERMIQDQLEQDAERMELDDKW
eukprot:86837_1